MNIVNTTFITTGEEAKDGTAKITATNSDLNGVIGNFAGKAELTAREIDGSAITAGIDLESSDEDILTATADYIVNSDLIAVKGNIKAEVGTIVDSVLMAKDGSVDLDASGEIDGMALTAKEDLKVSAEYIVGSILKSALNGDLSVTAGKIIIDSTVVSAGGIALLGDEIDLNYAIVAATAGNAELSGDIKAAGVVEVSAQKAVFLNGNLEGGDDVRFVADELELFGDSYAVTGVLDITGARETVVNVNNTTIKAAQMRLGDVNQEESMTNDLKLEGGKIHLAGDIFVENLNVKADKLSNENGATVTAVKTATIEGKKPLAIGQTYALNVNADEVTVTNGSDVQVTSTSSVTVTSPSAISPPKAPLKLAVTAITAALSTSTIPKSPLASMPPSQLPPSTSMAMTIS